MSFWEKIVNFFSKGKKTQQSPVVVPPVTAPRENKEGQEVPPPPTPDPADADAVYLPSFAGASKLRYPLAAEFVKDPDVGGRMKPEYVVIHHTVSYDTKSTISIFMKNVVDIHYILGKKGEVVQMAENNQECAHAGQSSYNGKSGFNNFSIGIEVVNIGPLSKKDGKYYDYYKRLFTGPVRERKGLGYQYWEAATEAQEQSLINLCWYLHKVVGIPVDNFVGHYEISPGRKNDPYGLLSWGDMNAFRAHLKDTFKRAQTGPA